MQQGVKESDVYLVDVGGGKAEDYAAAFQGADAVVIATSAVPELVPLSILKVGAVRERMVMPAGCP